MRQNNYLNLKNLILGATPSEEILHNPSFLEYCQKTPLDMVMLCINSPILPRADLLASIPMTTHEALVAISASIQLATNTKSIAEFNRSVFSALLAKIPNTALQSHHVELDGMTIGARFISQKVLWMLDMLGELGVNPYYDDAGACVLLQHEKTRNFLGEACRHGLRKKYISPKDEDIVYSLLDSTLDVPSNMLTLLDELGTLSIGVHEGTRKHLFSLYARKSLKKGNAIVRALVLQYLAHGQQHVSDNRHEGQSVLEQSPTAREAFVVYAAMDPVWLSESVQEYIGAHSKELFEALERYCYQDFVFLLSGHEDQNKQSICELRASITTEHGLVSNTSSEAENAWIPVYASSRSSFDFDPAQQALFDYAIAEVERAARNSVVNELLWTFLLQECTEDLYSYATHHLNSSDSVESTVQKAHNEYMGKIERRPGFSKDGLHAKEVVPGVLQKMKHFVQNRPRFLEKRKVMDALAQWLKDHPEVRKRMAEQLQAQLLGQPERPSDIYTIDKNVLPSNGGPIPTRLYTEEALARYKKYVDEQPTRKQNVAFYARAVRDGLHEKTLASCIGVRAKLDALRSTFLHFSDVIDHVENHLYLCEKGSGAFYVPPVLLVGGPGIGKTFFLHELANAVSTTFEMIGMESVTSGFDITGLTEAYSTGAPGRLLNCLLTSQALNPIVLLDEIEKSGGDSRYSVINGLLPLLERYTAKKFKDECLPLEVDASHVVWFATANDDKRLSGPIKSRFDTFYIQSPTMAQKNALTQGVYARLIESNAWGAHLEKTLVPDVLDALSRASTPGAARDVRRILTTACSRALREDSASISVRHLGLSSALVLPWDANSELPLASGVLQ